MALVLTGCSSSPPTASSSTTASSTSPSTSSSTSTSAPGTTTSGAPSTTATTAPASTTSTTAHSGLTTCQVSQLSILPEQGSGAAGTIELSVSLTNTSGTTCTLFGYPGMQLLAAGDTRISTNVVRGGGPQFPVPAANQAPATVTLAPRHAAAFGLSYSDVPVGGEETCPTSSTAEVTPPGDFSSGVVALTIAPCGGGTVHVSPVYLAT